MSILAIDAGTTGVTALIVHRGRPILARGYREFPQHFPARAGSSTTPTRSGRPRSPPWPSALGHARTPDGDAPTRGRHHQPARDVVLWDRETLGAPRRAIVWQDRRTAGMCDQLRADGHEPRVAALTGLRLDPYFSATKLAWIAAQRAARVGQVDERAHRGRHRRLVPRRPDDPRPAPRHRRLERLAHAAVRHRTPATGADELCDALRRARSTRCPRSSPSYGVVGRTDPCGVPRARPADRGHRRATSRRRCSARPASPPGTSKCTYGTGSFVLVNTGDRPVAVRPPACSPPWPGSTRTAASTYALEGAVFVTGAAVQWLRDGLQIIERAAETEALARSGARLRRRGVRPGADRARRPGLGPARPRHDPRHHPRHDARAPRPGDPRGDRLRGAATSST